MGFIVLVVLVLAGMFSVVVGLFRVAPSQLVGYWSSPLGEFFELASNKRLQGCDRTVPLSAVTASGFMGAKPAKAYPVVLGPGRQISIRFPLGEVRGRVGIDRRRIIWESQGLWIRQGV